MKTISDRVNGLGLALLLIAASTWAIAQDEQGCTDLAGNPVACAGEAIDTADGTGTDAAAGVIDTADGTGTDAAAGVIDTADGTGTDAAERLVVDTADGTGTDAADGASAESEEQPIEEAE